MHNIAKILTENVNGTTFIGLTSETSVKLTGGKANPLQGRVTKQTTGANVMVFQNKSTNGYNNMVQKRLEAEGKAPESFELSPRKWGSRIEGTPFIEHKGKYYVEVIFLNAGATTYRVDGKPTHKDEIVGLPSKKEATQGGLEDKVIIRTFSVDSIKGLTINKEYYTNLYFVR